MYAPIPNFQSTKVVIKLRKPVSDVKSGRAVMLLNPQNDMFTDGFYKIQEAQPSPGSDSTAWHLHPFATRASLAGQHPKTTMPKIVTNRVPSKKHRSGYCQNSSEIDLDNRRVFCYIILTAFLTFTRLATLLLECVRKHHRVSHRTCTARLPSRKPVSANRTLLSSFFAGVAPSVSQVAAGMRQQNYYLRFLQSNYWFPFVSPLTRKRKFQCLHVAKGWIECLAFQVSVFLLRKER